jgi:putative colanic acid biosysnthesis UDP-glucose lipid carrier transferase
LARFIPHGLIPPPLEELPVIRSVRPHPTILFAGQRLVDLAVITGCKAATWGIYVHEWTSLDWIQTLVALLTFLFAAEANNLYRAWRGAPLGRELRVVLWTWLIAAIVVIVSHFLTKTSEDFSRVATISWFLSAGIGLVLIRSAKKVVLGKVRAHGRNTRSAGIIGCTPIAQRLRQELSDPSHGIRVVGIYDSRDVSRVRACLGDEELAGNVEDAIEAARAGKLDLVYITLPLRAEHRIAEAAGALADTTATVRLVTDFSAFNLLSARWSAIGDLPTVSLVDTPFSGVSGRIKRAEDLVLGSLFLLIASPVMLLIALAIKLTSRGPVIFVQDRYGLNGKKIRVFKFRSMTTADNGAKVEQAKRHDPRITRLGAFLRSSSLDELPQLMNVVLGDMSIVGPRPHAVAHNEGYRSLIPGYMLRHKVKPGITGWAQVNGFRGETDTEDKMRSRVEFDLEYIENWDLRWDLEIILRTVFTAWRSPNAY